MKKWILVFMLMLLVAFLASPVGADEAEHQSVVDPAVAPTCTETGLTEGSHCTVCGLVLVPRETVPALGHSMGAWYDHTPPAAAERGERRSDCDRCDYYESDFTMPLGHVQASAESLTDGQRLVLMDRNIVMSDKYMFFSCQLDTLGSGSVRMGHGESSYASQYLEITATQLKVTWYYTASSQKTYTFDHGLDISQWLEVQLHKAEGDATVTILTESGEFTTVCDWRTGCNGEIFCQVDGASLRNVDCRWWCDGLAQDIWLFGDSYFGTASNSHWTSYLFRDGHGDVLLAGYPGMGTPVGFQQFEAFLEFGTPKYAVWCLGMNNGDSNGVPNKTWLTYTQRFLELCQQYGITPILSTIPTTPRVNNRYKNAWVESSGYRYIDFNIAVRADNDVDQWIDGMLGSDDLHPAAPGAQALYRQALADFPELANGKPETCVHSLQPMGQRPAQCEFGGRRDFYICTLCGSAFADAQAALPVDGVQQRLPPAGHNRVIDPLVEPTCDRTGLTAGEYCATCGEVYVQQEILAPLGHYYEETVIPPDCTHSGFTSFSCIRCASHYTDAATDPLGHSYQSVVTAPTATEYGYTTHTCSTCGDSYVDSYTEPTVHIHSYGNWTVTVQPTCTVPGEEVGLCSCGDSLSRPVDPLGHDYSKSVTDPTCTEAGFTTHLCAQCGDSYRDTPVEPLGHQYHMEVTAPTCTEQGFTTYSCIRCDDRYTDAYVDAVGHTYGQWVTVTAPTCTAQGEQMCSCSCGDTLIDALEPLGHSYVAEVTPPTAWENGFTTHTCSTCGDSYQDAVVPALGPSTVSSDLYKVEDAYITGICVDTTVAEFLSKLKEADYCKIFSEGREVSSEERLCTGMTLQLIVHGQLRMELTVIVFGDVNGDGKITVTDMVAVKAMLLGKTDADAISEKAGDVNGDGKLTVTDFMRLKAHLLGINPL